MKTSILEELRKNGRHHRILREKLSLYTYFQVRTIKNCQKYTAPQALSSGFWIFSFIFRYFQHAPLARVIFTFFAYFPLLMVHLGPQDGAHLSSSSCWNSGTVRSLNGPRSHSQGICKSTPLAHVECHKHCFQRLPVSEERMLSASLRWGRMAGPVIPSLSMAWRTARSD